MLGRAFAQARAFSLSTGLTITRSYRNLLLPLTWETAVSTYQERKAARREHFEKSIKGWRLVKCGACNGSGYYDNCVRGRVPKCGCCGGTGKTKVSPKEHADTLAEEKRRQEDYLRDHATWEELYDAGFIAPNRKVREPMSANKTEPVSQLVDGRIPAHTVCPFRDACGFACSHLGKKHTVAYSCASARAFDLMARRAPAGEQ